MDSEPVVCWECCEAVQMEPSAVVLKVAWMAISVAVQMAFLMEHDSAAKLAGSKACTMVGNWVEMMDL